MWRHTLLCLILVGGCASLGRDEVEDVLRRPPTAWSTEECFNLIVLSMRHNLLDPRSPNIKVIATPFTPGVIAAINRISQLNKHWSDEETRNQIDTSLARQAGMYFEWQSNRLVDSRGYYLKSDSQLSALEFLVTLRNQSWPCNIPTMTIRYGTENSPLYKQVPLATPADWPCYIPEITNIDERILLSNDQGHEVKPQYVWGRKNNELTMEETLIVKFDLGGEGGRFLHGSRNISLVISGFESEIRLDFPLGIINPSSRPVAVE